MRRAVAIAIVLLACSGGVTHPPQGPGTDFPCGYHGVYCGGGLCCWEGDVCGSKAPGATCPPGYCCWEGDDNPTSYAARPPKPQWRPQ